MSKSKQHLIHESILLPTIRLHEVHHISFKQTGADSLCLCWEERGQVCCGVQEVIDILLGLLAIQTFALNSVSAALRAYPAKAAGLAPSRSHRHCFNIDP